MGKERIWRYEMINPLTLEFTKKGKVSTMYLYRHGADPRTTEEFIELAELVHGKRFDYSGVTYNYSKKRVLIICPEHGGFYQTPNSHLAGEGCPNCPPKFAELYKKSFIKKSKAIFGSNTFDYSKVDYKDYLTKVTLICKKHGEFEVRPVQHICEKSQCPECMRLLPLMTKKIFLKRAIAVHGNTYDYSSVEWGKRGAKDKIKIICKVHGVFKQIAQSHLLGNGCPKCANKKQAEKVSISSDSFLERALLMHGDQYSYDMTTYKKAGDKVKITCKKHGDFFQTGYQHLKGQGCPLCGREKISKARKAMTK